MLGKILDFVIGREPVQTAAVVTALTQGLLHLDR